MTPHMGGPKTRKCIVTGTKTGPKTGAAEDGAPRGDQPRIIGGGGACMHKPASMSHGRGYAIHSGSSSTSVAFFITKAPRGETLWVRFKALLCRDGGIVSLEENPRGQNLSLLYSREIGTVVPQTRKVRAHVDTFHFL